MKFIETKYELRSYYPKAIDKMFFGRPTERYYCPRCRQEKRKLVLFFEREDLVKKIHKRYEMSEPICQNCFEFVSYNRIMNDFYSTDIY